MIVRVRRWKIGSLYDIVMMSGSHTIFVNTHAFIDFQSAQKIAKKFAKKLGIPYSSHILEYQFRKAQ